MAETKMALMTRLRAEGRWEEADKFREETRERLRAEGLRREDARQKAWRLTAERYPIVVATIPNRPDAPLQRIEAVKEGDVIEHTEDERQQLSELVQRPCAWTWNVTEAIERVMLKARQEADFSPSEASSVLEWLAWTLWIECGDLFFSFALGEYLLRHGESLSSIAWPKDTKRAVQLRRQFTNDMKSVGSTVSRNS